MRSKKDIKIYSLENSEGWWASLKGMGKKTLTHFPSYSKVFEDYGDGTANCFVFESEHGMVLYPHLIRPILKSNGCRDVITPYGYGGPVYEFEDDIAIPNLVRDFRKAFFEYAKDNNIISEFIRFHPFLQNQIFSHAHMDSVELHCVNAMLDLSVGADQLFLQFRSSYQQCIRSAVKTGLTVNRVSLDTFIDPFFELYSASMVRKNQYGYLRFRRDLLVLLSDNLRDNLECFLVQLDNSVLAGAIFLRYGDYLDYFLAASDPGKLNLRPNHLLIHEVAIYAINKGLSWLHLGGGHESLKFFKHGFANDSREYFIGKHVHDKNIYQELTEDHFREMGKEWDGEDGHFPAYRAG